MRAGEHHGQAIGEGERLLLVVGDQDEGDADRALQLAQLDMHVLAQLLVEGRERLVEQEDLGAHDQRAGEGHALALAAGELVRAAGAEAGQRHHGQRVGDAAIEGRAVEVLLAQAVADIFRHAEVGEDRVGLEDHVGRALVGRDPGHGFAGDGNRAFAGLIEAGEHAQERGLAAAGRAQQREELAGADGERDVVEGGERAEAAGDAADVDDGRLPAHARGSPATPVRRSARRRRSSAVPSRISENRRISEPRARTLGSLAAKRSWLQM